MKKINVNHVLVTLVVTMIVFILTAFAMFMIQGDTMSVRIVSFIPVLALIAFLVALMVKIHKNDMKKIEEAKKAAANGSAFNPVILYGPFI